MRKVLFIALGTLFIFAGVACSNMTERFVSSCSSIDCQKENDSDFQMEKKLRMQTNQK